MHHQEQRQETTCTEHGSGFLEQREGARARERHVRAGRHIGVAVPAVIVVRCAAAMVMDGRFGHAKVDFCARDIHVKRHVAEICE